MINRKRSGGTHSQRKQKRQAGKATRVEFSRKALRTRREWTWDGETRRGIEKPEEEREARRGHFKQITQRGGCVLDEVWKHPGAPRTIAKWMGEETTDDEIRKCEDKMMCGKASGDDDMAVELPQYAGEETTNIIYGIVQKHETSGESGKGGGSGRMANRMEGRYSCSFVETKQK